MSLSRFDAGPVLVVGAGPVGLALALALHRRKVPVMVLEQRAEPRLHARTIMLQPPALAFLHRIGLLEPLLRVGEKVQRVSWVEEGAVKRHLDYGALTGHTPWPFRLHVPLRALIDGLIQALPVNTIWWERRAVDLEHTADGVVLRLEDGTRLHGSWLIGVDGLTSTIRELAKIDVEWGPHRSFTSFAVGPGFAAVLPPDVGGCIYFRTPTDWAVAARTREGYRLLTSLDERGPLTASLTDEALSERLRRLGVPGFPVSQIEERKAYTIHSRIATRFRRGRILLAGDAALLLLPLGGNGLNMGLLGAATIVDALCGDEPDRLYAYGVDRPQRLRRFLHTPTGALLDLSLGHAERSDDADLLLMMSLLAAT